MTHFRDIFSRKKMKYPLSKTAFFVKNGSFTEGVFYEKGELFK